MIDVTEFGVVVATCSGIVTAISTGVMYKFKNDLQETIVKKICKELDEIKIRVGIIEKVESVK